MKASTSTADTNTTSYHRLDHMPKQDILNFGISAEMTTSCLPTYQDVLRHYFFLADRAKMSNKMFSYKTFTPNVVDKLIEIWSNLNIEIYDRKYISKKLYRFIDKYHKENKSKNTSNTFHEFLASMKKLFFIATCKCDLERNKCSCEKIPAHLEEFMFDQHNERKLRIPEYNESDIILPTIETTPIDEDDPLYEPTHSELLTDTNMLDIAMNTGDNETTTATKRGHYTQGYFDTSSLMAFQFDERKDESQTREKIGETLHPRMVKGPHLVVAREPGTSLIGYVNLAGEDAETKTKELKEFFDQKNLNYNELIAICCDGEPINTDVDNGIIRRFELDLKKPLHWCVCLLHFNELPFRHLYDTLEKSKSTGPRTSSGGLLKLLQQCETLQPVKGFKKIPLENMPPPIESETELSKDVSYLYKMARAVSIGNCPKELANFKTGPIVHSRWITKASRILRLYVTTNKPSNNLITLAAYVMKVYVPMYFNVKYYNSVIHGSVLLSKFIRWTQYLNPSLRNVVITVVLNNSYYAHSENVLLTMLYDDRKTIRDKAIRKILYIRDKLGDSDTTLRKYIKPINIDFDCTDYVHMVNLDEDSILHEPPFTRTIPYEYLQEFLDCDDEGAKPFEDPGIACHIQGTERFVQLCTSVSKRVSHKHREGVESREKVRKMETKRDLRH